MTSTIDLMRDALLALQNGDDAEEHAELIQKMRGWIANASAPVPSHSKWLALSGKAIADGHHWTAVQLENGVCFDIITPAVITPREHDAIVQKCAAAPDLLEALNGLIADMGDRTESNCSGGLGADCDRARAAIAKAGGAR